MSDLERQMNILAIALNLSMDEVESMTLDKLTNEFTKLSFLNDLPKAPIKFTFKLRGRYFRLAKTPNEMCGHHFIELQQVFNGDVIESLNKIVALLSVEVDFFGRNKKVVDAQAHYEDKCGLMMHLPVPLPYTYALFFLEVYPELLKNILCSLTDQMKEMKEQLTNPQ
jgi:hypothetical protein